MALKKFFKTNGIEFNLEEVAKMENADALANTQAAAHIPEKSQAIYEKVFEKAKEWKAENPDEEITEDEDAKPKRKKKNN